jgi:hypothetical protein
VLVLADHAREAADTLREAYPHVQTAGPRRLGGGGRGPRLAERATRRPRPHERRSGQGPSADRRLGQGSGHPTRRVRAPNSTGPGTQLDGSGHPTQRKRARTSSSVRP